MIDNCINIICPCCNEVIRVDVELITSCLQEHHSQNKEDPIVHMQCFVREWTVCGERNHRKTDNWDKVTCIHCNQYRPPENETVEDGTTTHYRPDESPHRNICGKPLKNDLYTNIPMYVSCKQCIKEMKNRNQQHCNKKQEEPIIKSTPTLSEFRIHFVKYGYKYSLCGELRSNLPYWTRVTSAVTCEKCNRIIEEIDTHHNDIQKKEAPVAGLVQMPPPFTYLTETVGLTEDEAKIVIELVNLFKKRSVDSSMHEGDKPPPVTDKTIPSDKTDKKTDKRELVDTADKIYKQVIKEFKESFKSMQAYIEDLHKDKTLAVPSKDYWDGKREENAVRIDTASPREKSGVGHQYKLVRQCRHCQGNGYVNCEWSNELTECPVCHGETTEPVSESKENIQCNHQFIPQEAIQPGQSTVQCQCTQCGRLSVVELWPGNDLAKKPECDKSPTGQHVWNWISSVPGSGVKCNYCGKTHPV